MEIAARFGLKRGWVQPSPYLCPLLFALAMAILMQFYLHEEAAIKENYKGLF
jgi:hypothetical protein